jgi:hypothetical protein
MMLMNWGDRNVIKKNTEALLDARKGVDLEINNQNTKYMFMFCNQRHHNLMLANCGRLQVISFLFVFRLKFCRHYSSLPRVIRVKSTSSSFT